MKILLLTDNFPPETNAPANRSYEHAKAWVRSGHDVTVVTGVPNFPRGVVFDGYENRPYQSESIDGIRVARVWTYIAANEGFVRRTLDYVSFMLSGSLGSFFQPRPDVVIATSPQFFSAIAGWVVSRAMRRPFVFELRDLWPETIAAVGAIKSGAALRGLERLARFLYREADLMVPVTEAFAEHLRSCGVPPERIAVVTNGIDVDALRATRPRRETRLAHGLPPDAFIASYVGTHGLCQGLEAVLEAAKRLEGDRNVHFCFVGEGADKGKVVALARTMQVKNVTFLEGQSRQEAVDLVHASDACLVVLRDDPLFSTVIPSKIFEAMALERPIVMAVPRGEGTAIVTRNECGIAVQPEDASEIADAIRSLVRDPDRALAMGQAGRRAVRADFERTRLAAKMLEAISGVLR